MARTRQIGAEVLALLREGSIDGNVFMLHPSRQLGGGNPLPRDLYTEFNKTMTDLGGKWVKSQGGHVFASSPGDAIADAMEAGATQVGASTKQVLGQFYTPPELANMLVDQLLGMGRTRPRILEPSAGKGAIVEALLTRYTEAEVWTYEIDKHNQDVIAALVKKYPQQVFLRGGDFLTHTDETKFHAVVMNPPFAKGAEHVTRAFSMLEPGGRLVAIMSGGISFRTDRRTTAFRRLVEQRDGKITPLPEGSFKASGTEVSTVMVTMQAEEP